MQYIAMIHDTNLAHSTTLYSFDSIAEAESVIRHAGTWCIYRLALGGESGAMVLDAPSVFLYKVPPYSTPKIAATLLLREIRDGLETYADARLVTGPKGGVVRAW